MGVLDDFRIVTANIDETDIKIYPIADVHLGAKEHDSKAWSKFRERVANEDDAYLILAGDMINNSTRGSVGNPYEEELPPSEQKKVLYDQLWPLKDKILCGVTGNHEARSVRDVDNDPLYDVFVNLGIQERYRRNMAFLKVKMRFQNYSFCVAHGASRTRTGYFAYSVNVDCLITGHTHTPAIEQPTRYCMPQHGNRVQVRDMVTVVVPSWLEPGGYSLSKMYQPKTTSKPQVIYLSANSKRTEAKKISVSSGDLF